jgi:hypothetical protein
VTTRQYAWVLSQGMLFDEDIRGDGLRILVMMISI